MANTVKVRVRCVVDLPVGHWGSDSNIDELTKIAKREGIEKLQKIMRDNHGGVYGEPSVVFVMCENQ